MMRDQAPVGNTCPMIDQVIRFLENIEWDEGEGSDEKECKEIIDIMENIRRHNSELREWGNDMYSQNYENEKDKDYFEGKYEDLKKEHDSVVSEKEKLEEEIEKLEEEIENLESQLNELQS